MRQRRLGKLARKACCLAAPIPEGRTWTLSLRIAPELHRRVAEQAAKGGRASINSSPGASKKWRNETRGIGWPADKSRVHRSISRVPLRCARMHAMTDDECTALKWLLEGWGNERNGIVYITPEGRQLVGYAMRKLPSRGTPRTT
jgi:hypothetical protein